VAAVPRAPPHQVIRSVIKLSARWAKDLVSQPETGMGYLVASVYLKDGRRFDQVVIVGGTISGIRGNQSLPFEESDIDRIVVTHEK
jgi:hypothetical protein